MSMLTPPGMGGKYKITGNAYPRMRRPHRRRRRVLAGVAALVTLSVLAWGTLELIDVFSGHREANAAQRECKSSSGTAKTSGKGGKADKSGKGSAQPRTAQQSLPKPAGITVNVFNATPRTGLAKKAADELKRRGFKIGKVGNAPAVYDKKVDDAALLVGGSDAKDVLSVLGAHVTGERTQADTRKDASVDLVIGRAYKALDPAPAAAKALATMAQAPPPTETKQAKHCKS
ncbi:LytR C-terminal domain-containing protein [Wenjunlia tyrosinilytica]|uniref:Membrane protein n=1 Tax=Wenjunlia tyrosinilytica TaxID=1544741 RepID=A0A917ZN10_9ACTN|nr:LytR C-terminal domain-containing protein [Wenjunlia tyrosinilytica]GGO86672.1 membrane protein [Wenjunlia tyrosinilytica]